MWRDWLVQSPLIYVHGGHRLMEITLKTVTVMFKAYVFHDIEVPDDWKPTPENLSASRTKAWDEVNLEVNRNDWNAETLEVDGESFELD